MSSKKFTKGFTLLELLVVISIIGILIVLGISAYSVAQKRGRDARRYADMGSLQDALEQFYVENSSSYPAASGCSDLVTAMGSDYWSGGTPTDPKPSAYAYSCSSAASSYCLCAQLEQTGSGNSNAGCNYTDGGNYFCVSNLQ